jgi:Na+/melibiose symporter-like transporter
MFILTLAHFAVLAMRGGTLFYYFQYYVNSGKLFSVLDNLGLTSAAGGAHAGAWYSLLNTFGLVVDSNRGNVASVGFSLFNISSQFVTIIGVAFSTTLCARFGKKAVALAGFSVTTVFMLLFVLVPAESVGTLFLLVGALRVSSTRRSFSRSRPASASAGPPPDGCSPHSDIAPTPSRPLERSRAFA